MQVPSRARFSDGARSPYLLRAAPLLLQFDETSRHQRIERAAKRGKREHGGMMNVMSMVLRLARIVPSCSTPAARATRGRTAQSWCAVHPVGADSPAGVMYSSSTRSIVGYRGVPQTACNPLPSCADGLVAITLARNSLSYAARGAK